MTTTGTVTGDVVRIALIEFLTTGPHHQSPPRQPSPQPALLHDARQTAATVLLLLQIPDRTVMAIMGWSNTAMAARYQHIIAAIRRDVATSVGGLLWTPAEPGDDATGGCTGGIVRQMPPQVQPDAKTPVTTSMG